MLSPERRKLRSRVAALSQSRPEDHPDLIAARAELRSAAVDEHIARLVNDAPPLTESQRARLATLLQPVRPGAAA